MGGCRFKSASGHRWLFLRSAAALVVTGFAAVVIVMGLLHLLLRRASIQLHISQSDVYVRRLGTIYYFRFYLEAYNPSDLFFVHYRNITVQLLDTPPTRGLLAEFIVTPPSISLAPTEEQEFLVWGQAENVSNITVQKLFTVENGAEVPNAGMVVTGVVCIDNNKGVINFYNATFDCPQLKIRSNARLPEPSSKNFRSDCV